MKERKDDMATEFKLPQIQFYRGKKRVVLPIIVEDWWVVEQREDGKFVIRDAVRTLYELTPEQSEVAEKLFQELEKGEVK